MNSNLYEKLQAFQKLYKKKESNMSQDIRDVEKSVGLTAAGSINTINNPNLAWVASALTMPAEPHYDPPIEPVFLLTIPEMDIEAELIKATKHDREHEPMVFSASMIGNDLLQNYYMFLYGPKKVDTFSEMTSGSLMHLGIENALKDNPKVILEKRLTRKLKNNWVISGKFDMFEVGPLIIHDWKNGKNYSRKQFIKDPLHPYRLQPSVYAWLIINNKRSIFLKKFESEPNHAQTIVNSKSLENYRGSISWIMKDSDIKKSQPTFIKDIFPVNKDIEQILINTTDELDAAIKSSKLPRKCLDTWIAKPRGFKHSIEMRCEFYCQFKDVCDYFKPSSQQETNTISAW